MEFRRHVFLLGEREHGEAGTVFPWDRDVGVTLGSTPRPRVMESERPEPGDVSSDMKTSFCSFLRIVLLLFVSPPHRWRPQTCRGEGQPRGPPGGVLRGAVGHGLRRRLDGAERVRGVPPAGVQVRPRDARPRPHVLLKRIAVLAPRLSLWERAFSRRPAPWACRGAGQ